MQTSRNVDLQKALLLRIANGDEQAFSELYELLSKPLAALAYQILNDAQEVEEVMQDVFVSVWKHASSYDPKLSRPFSWLVVITRRQCWNKLRSKGRHIRKLEALEKAESAPVIPLNAIRPDSFAEQHELSETVGDRLGTFPENQEKALRLALFEGLTHDEIADQLKTPLGTVKTWIRRGLLKIRIEMEVEA